MQYTIIINMAIAQRNEVDMKKHRKEKFSDIYDTNLHGWGFNFRRSQLYRFEKYMTLIKQNNVQRNHSCRVLEVGCGEGFFTFQYLSIIFTNVTGVDIASNAIERATAYARSRKKKDKGKNFFLVDSLPDLSAVEGSFDFITLNELLYYLSKEDQQHALKRVWDLCVDDGYLMISVNIGAPPYFTREEITGLVETYFDVVDSADMCIKQYYDHIETKIWQLLEIVQPGFWRQSHRIDTIPKKIARTILDNRIAMSTYNPLISYLCKKILYYMPIRCIDALGRKVSYDKNLSIYVLLCKKRQTRI